MKIKTTLNTSILTSIILIGTLMISQAVVFNLIAKEDAKLLLAESTRNLVFELNLIVRDPGASTHTDEWLNGLKNRWQPVYDSGLSVLQRVEEEERESDFVREIRVGYLIFGNLFNEWASSHENLHKLIREKAPKEEIDLALNFEEKKTEELLATSQLIVDLSNELHDRTLLQVTSQQKLNRNLFFSLMAILLAVTMAASLRTLREITEPIETLIKANKKVEGGDFKSRVKLKTGNEFQDLGEAFNKGVAALEKIEEAREELSKLKREVEIGKQVDKAREQILFRTSHELKTPLTPIMIQTQMMKEGDFGKVSDKQKESLNTILRNMQRLNSLIEDILLASRIHIKGISLEIKGSDVGKMVKEVVKKYLPIADKNKISLVNNIPDNLVVSCDPRRIEQVFINLIDNAFKFTSSGGSITLDYGRDEKGITFKIADTGIGISKEDQRNLFSPFFQAKMPRTKAVKGIGLGLSICKGIVEQHKGKIWLESKPGKGSTFYFYLPSKK